MTCYTIKDRDGRSIELSLDGRCEICGQRPAVVRVPFEDTEFQLCGSCALVGVG